MAKFDFQNSRYAKFFQSDTNVRWLQKFVDESDLFYTNYTWYLSQGKKAPLPATLNADGTAMFMVKAKKLTAAPLMHLRAPLGDAPVADKNGISFYAGSVPNFIADGFVETAAERDVRAKMYEEFGNDADIVAAWADEVQTKMDSVDATLTYMTASLMSTGKIDYDGIGMGAQALLQKAAIPDDNFVTAGSVAWTDSTCRILDQMQAIEEAYREKFAFRGELVWQMPRDMFFNVLLPNAQVQELIASFKANPMHFVAQTEGQTPTETEFRNAITDFVGISHIDVVTEKVYNRNGVSDGFIHGWDQNVAVLRPAGDAVEFQWTTNFDKAIFEKYGSTSITKVWASTNNGLGTLVNTTLNNGLLQEWHTDMMLTSCPALLNFPYHYIIDTTTADS